MSDANVAIQFSTAAPPTRAEKWRDKSFVDTSRWICRVTHSPFSHVDYQMIDGLVGASDNPYAPVMKTNPPGNARGVAMRPHGYQRFAIRRVAVVPCTFEVKQKFHDFCWSQLGKPFDGEALKVSTFLSGSFENRDWRWPSRWFCAELMARAAEVSGLIPWKIIGVKNRVTAGDLLLMLNPLIDVELFWRLIPGLIVSEWEV